MTQESRPIPRREEQLEEEKKNVDRRLTDHRCWFGLECESLVMLSITIAVFLGCLKSLEKPVENIPRNFTSSTFKFRQFRQTKICR
jgi:hypothetical protein